jgi:hypothetical protein
MKTHSILAIFATLALTIAPSDTAATEKLSLRVTPNVSNAPSNVIVKATVAKDSANRWLTIEAESGTFFRSSAIQLDGDNAPTVTEFHINNLPSGEYSVSAVLKNNVGEEIVVRRTVIVLARFGEP